MVKILPPKCKQHDKHSHSHTKDRQTDRELLQSSAYFGKNNDTKEIRHLTKT